MTKKSETDIEDEASGIKGSKQLPCLHDPRPFVNVMPLGLHPELLREVKEFFPSCPYFSVAGSKYCRPHMIMNNAVTPELASNMNDWQEHSIAIMARGYTVLLQGTMYRHSTYPHRFDTNGIGRVD